MTQRIYAKRKAARPAKATTAMDPWMPDAEPSKGAGELVGAPVAAGAVALLGGAGDPVPMGTTGTVVSGEVGVSPAGGLDGAAPQTVTVTVTGAAGGGTAVVSPEVGVVPAGME